MQRPPCASLSLGYLSTRAMQLKPGKHMRYAHTVSLITKIGTSKQLSKLKITTFFLARKTTIFAWVLFIVLQEKSTIVKRCLRLLILNSLGCDGGVYRVLSGAHAPGVV